MRLDALRPFDLTRRTALVTGARREIGRAIALGLAGLGARLAVHHAGTEEEARDAAGVVAEIRAAGGQAEAFGCDFTQNDAGKRLARDVLGAFGVVDILVLNASIELVEDWRSVARERFDRRGQFAEHAGAVAGAGATHGRAWLGTCGCNRKHTAGSAA
jgi:glucose 1-dehydrogenase